MQLKVTPKEALTLLGNLIKKGDELYEWIRKNYENAEYVIEVGEKKSIEEFKKKKLAEEKKMNTEELKKKKEEERKQQEFEEAKKKGELTIKIENRPPLFLESIKNAMAFMKSQESTINEAVKTAQKSATFLPHLIDTPVEDGSWSIDKRNKFYSFCIEEYEEKAKKWIQKAYNVLEKISGDYVYFRQFELTTSKWQRTHLRSFLHEQVDDKFDDYAEIHSEILEKTKFLQDLYLEIEKQANDPLFYITETNKLCYYNRVIQLQSSSNQSSFCEFMFQFAIGEKKEVAEIVAFMEGDNIELMLKVDKRKVINAMNEVNEKTKKMFGFPLFHKDKNTVYICPNP